MSEDIYVRDPDSLERKLSVFHEGGSKGLCVIADFDRTLTLSSVEGVRVHTTQGLLQEPDILSPDYTRQTRTLYAKYRPFELDIGMDPEERREKMKEWAEQMWNLLITNDLRKETIERVVEKKSIHMREGGFRFLDMIADHDVPLLVCSAGVGDIIVSYLESEGRLYENMDVLSNFLDFDEEGRATGLKSELMHMGVKDGSKIKQSDFYAKMHGRGNVLLLGDMIHDVKMLEGLEYDCALTIGFLNEKIEENIKGYQNLFDVVIVNDGPMNYVNEVVERVL